MRAIIVLGISIAILSTGQGSGATWYVDDSVPSSGNGTSAATAFKSIQEGIDASSHGDTVIVAEGTYIENIRFNGKNIVLTSTDPFDPTLVANTIIDGNQAGSVVTFASAENHTCILSGFTVQNGKADSGGGVCGGTLGQQTQATIENNTISTNSAAWGGGLCFCDGAIRNNMITANSAYGGGGLAGCNGMIENNTIIGNSAGWGGGLYYCDGTVRSNMMTGNSAESEGGALYHCDGTIESNTIGDNSGNGLAYCKGAILNNTITGNSGWSGGGLIWCSGTVENNVITGNSAQESGGGLALCGGAIRNNTIVHNSAQNLGGGLFNCEGTIRNCIIWGNTAPTGPQLYESSVPTYSCIEGWNGDPATENSSEDPRFVDPDGPDNDPATYEDNNYRLSAGSPCIDVGLNEVWMWSGRDLDGNPRILYGGLSETVDMGAYEYAFKITQILMAGTGAFQITWTSRLGEQYVVRSCADVSSGDWTQEATVPSAGDSTSWTDASPSGSRGFYKVELK